MQLGGCSGQEAERQEGVAGWESHACSGWWASTRWGFYRLLGDSCGIQIDRLQADDSGLPQPSPVTGKSITDGGRNTGNLSRCKHLDVQPLLSSA